MPILLLFFLGAAAVAAAASRSSSPAGSGSGSGSPGGSPLTPGGFPGTTVGGSNRATVALTPIQAQALGGAPTLMVGSSKQHQEKVQAWIHNIYGHMAAIHQTIFDDDSITADAWEKHINALWKLINDNLTPLLPYDPNLTTLILDMSREHKATDALSSHTKLDVLERLQLLQRWQQLLLAAGGPPVGAAPLQQGPSAGLNFNVSVGS